jgi:ribonuclease BN (tRNA processing enzyme)
MMKIVILGTGSSIPSARRLPSSFLVIAGRSTLLVDAGPSVMRRLTELGYESGHIDVVALSHFHPDHTVDLATFLFDCNFGRTPRCEPLTIIGGRGIRLFLGRLFRLYPSTKPIHYDLMIKTLQDRSAAMADFSIRTVSTDHKEESIGLRIEHEGKSVVFSGDTDYSLPLIELASGVDLLVSECTFPTKKRKGHLNLADLVKIVNETRPRIVIVTHLDPEWEEFPSPLPPPLLLGEDGMEIDL